MNLLKKILALAFFTAFSSCGAVYAGSVQGVRTDNNGNISFHNRDGSSTLIQRGTYTPTLTTKSGSTTALTAYESQWLRVGNTVIVHGRIDIADNTGNPQAHDIGVSLPIPSNFTSLYDLAGEGGIASTGATAGDNFWDADTSLNEATLHYYLAANAAWWGGFSFQYEIK